jgi:hypothetical protein
VDNSTVDDPAETGGRIYAWRVTSLSRLNLLLFAALIAHTIDHAVNQPARELPGSAGWIGIAGFVIVAFSAVVSLRQAEIAAPASLVAGLATAFGVVAVHLLPSWNGYISDPYADFGANAVSWALAIAPLAVGLWLAALGLRELRRPAAAA